MLIYLTTKDRAACVPLFIHSRKTSLSLICHVSAAALHFTLFGRHWFLPPRCCQGGIQLLCCSSRGHTHKNTQTHNQKHWEMIAFEGTPNDHSSFWMRTLESMSCVAYQKSIFQIYSGSPNIVISFCQQENTPRCEQTVDVHGSTSVLCKLHLLWFHPASMPTLRAQNLWGPKTSKHAVTNRFIQSCIRMLDVFSMTGSQIATIYQLPSFLSLHPAPSHKHTHLQPSWALLYIH